jgi:tellurite resistance protein
LGGGLIAFMLWRLRTKRVSPQPPDRESELPLPIFRSETRSFVAPIPKPNVAPPFGSLARQQGRWVEPGNGVTIGGLTITKGWFYLGQNLLPASGFGADNCLVNPDLPVARSDPDTAGSLMQYYPSYQSIDPRCRLAYLQWLSSARDDPAANIGYVFLYFYGIERRLMLDRTSAERPALIEEVERLRGVYARNGSFDRYSRALLDAALLLDADGKLYERSPRIEARSFGELPLGIRAAIGQLLHEKKPVPAEWMSAWFLAHPETRLGTAAHRAFPEFRALFLRRLQKAFPTGLTFDTPRRKLAARYCAASGTFELELEGPFREWPDIRDLTKPLESIRANADQCIADLAGYSRCIGKAGGSRDTLEAAAWLPAELTAEFNSSAMRAAESNLRRLASGDRTRLSCKQLLEALAMPPGDAKLSRSEGQTVAKLLERLGYGVEPDLRLATIGSDLDQPLVLYRLAGHGLPPARPDGAYQTGLLINHLSALVVHADGVIELAEEDRMMRQIDAIPTLGDAERLKLKANAAWLLASPPKLSRIRERLAALPEKSRLHLAEFAISVAAADGSVGAAEVKTLEKIYTAMGLPRERVHADIHSFQTGQHVDDELVVVQQAQPRAAPRYPIPAPPAAPTTPTIRLDLSKIARIQTDTQKAAALLSSIFVDETASHSEPELEPVHDEHDPLSGLDAAHASLVRDLLAHEEWPRADFERLVRSLKLLPDGAIETINEWAFDQFDDVLLEDGESIVIHRDRLHLLEDSPP